ncbi:MAG: hypothetical protein QOD88_442 [Mycobacterium sp.]|nr:hypothetical protein [Mycobacterium sp.]
MGVGLTNREIEKVVNDYIGVTEGHFGDFSFSTHADFHPALRDLDVNLSLYGKTREQFVDLLASQPPEDQAKILQGLIEICPSEADNPPRKRAKTASEMLTWVKRLESGSQVVAPVPEATRAVVVRALADAEQLLRTAGAPSSVDRVHTALHGHLLALCEAAGIETQPNASMAATFKALRRSHPNLAAVGPQQPDIEKVLNATSAIFDALGPVRNRASVAHPNSHLLGEDEACLSSTSETPCSTTSTPSFDETTSSPTPREGVVVPIPLVLAGLLERRLRSRLRAHDSLRIALVNLRTLRCVHCSFATVGPWRFS